jgi:hypothetical protein
MRGRTPAAHGTASSAYGGAGLYVTHSNRITRHRELMPRRKPMADAKCEAGTTTVDDVPAK